MAWAQGARAAAARGVPFSNVEGLVAHRGQLGGQERHVERRDALPGVAVLAVDLLDVVRQPTRHERRARGRAVHEGVVAVQLDALGDERVRVRRQHVWIVPADVVPSRVVRHEEDEVGLVGRQG